MSLNASLFDADLIRRFDVNGPRYTSYPTADQFHSRFTHDDVERHLRHVARDKPLSLYFHLPFCNTICYYCACNKIITKDHGRSAKYLKYLDKELALTQVALGGRLPVSQLHWGGGTPTFLSHDEMQHLMQLTHTHFDLQPNGEYSIEVDPRKVDRETVALLATLGFNRMSIGVQDFDVKVQTAINRLQSEAETRLVMDAAREHGFVSISMDLIYGLPHQTVEGFNVTLDKVLQMSPDRLSIYNYAHLPHAFKPQRRIAEDTLPSPEQRLDILALAIDKLCAAGYVYIGMDHFAKPNDELALAQQHGQLHRNFQGYSTQADCDMLAFGVSSISKLASCYYQNSKTLDDYYDALDQQRLPIARGVLLTADDALRREIIQSLMCDFKLNIPAFEQEHQIAFKQYFAAEWLKLQMLAQDGLIQLSPDAIIVQKAGRMLVRVVAMVFDAYLAQRSTQGFSKVL